MIGSLKGTLEETGDDYAVIDVNGVGYTVFISSRLLASLTPGQAVYLCIETQVREDHIHLYGFADGIEREWFRLLLGVQRVGSKMALNILSAHSPAALQHAILAKDTAAFSRISGVGPKLAERIVVELKDKALKLPVSGAMPIPSASAPASASKTRGKVQSPAPLTPHEDAISALVNLGFARGDAYTAAMRAAETAGAEVPIDQLIRLSLKELAV